MFYLISKSIFTLCGNRFETRFPSVVSRSVHTRIARSATTQVGLRVFKENNSKIVLPVPTVSQISQVYIDFVHYSFRLKVKSA